MRPITKEIYYTIDGVDIEFSSLTKAKAHAGVLLSSACWIERLRGKHITKVVNGSVESFTEIKINKKNEYSFGKTIKL